MAVTTMNYLEQAMEELGLDFSKYPVQTAKFAWNPIRGLEEIFHRVNDASMDCEIVSLTKLVLDHFDKAPTMFDRINTEYSLTDSLIASRKALWQLHH